MNARATLAVVLALVFTTSACGPTSSLSVGVKEIDTNVLIGPPGTHGSAPPPSEPVPVPGFPGIVEPPPVPVPPEPDPQHTCPLADPLSTVVHPATPSSSRPPVAATYRYRNDGTYRIGDEHGALPKTSTRRVENVARDPSGSGFHFDVTIPGALGWATTTTYHVYPDAPSATEQPGIYIDRIETTRPSSPPLTFEPVPTLEVFQFPAAPGVSWSARSVDPFRHTAMSFDATIVRTEIVDACGTKIEAWVVDLKNGSLSDPVSNTDITFAASIGFAPQYGGLAVADALDWNGTDAGTPVRITNTARISAEPRLPS